MRSPLTGSPIPTWSRCAESTTYSSFSAGSLPGSLATRLADSILVTSTFVLASSEAGQRKVRQRLAIFTQSSDFFERVARADKEFLSACRIHRDGKLRAFGFVELRIVEIHAGMRPVERDARPRDV